MVTIHDKGSDNVRLRSGSGHVMTKKTSIWVPMCKEKRMKNSGESNFRYNSDVWEKREDEGERGSDTNGSASRTHDSEGLGNVRNRIGQRVK